MISKVDPSTFDSASTVQIDCDAANQWLAMDEIEDWAAAHGFVRTGEFPLRQVLLDGKRYFRAIGYRMSDEERIAIEMSHDEMVRRAEGLRGRVAIRSGNGE